MNVTEQITRLAKQAKAASLNSPNHHSGEKRLPEGDG